MTTALTEVKIIVLLADDFFFIAHDEATGRPRLSIGVTRIGLSGALLAELVLFGKIKIAQGAITVHDRTPPEDALAGSALHQLMSNPEVTSFRDWLSYLATGSYEQVAQRMIRAGNLEPTQIRKLFKSVAGYRPVNVNAAAWPVLRLSTRSPERAPPKTPDLVLTGLVMASGLDGFVFKEPKVAAYLRSLLPILPPPLRELLVNTEAAIGDAVLSNRS